jgi:antitoxin ParD1/3/4
MNAVTLPPDLERLASERIAAGRHRDLAELVTTGVSLLLRAEEERTAFIHTLEAAEAEGDRDAWFSLDQVMAKAAAIIAAKRRAA